MIVIGVGVHKQSLTAVAVDEAGRALAEVTVAAAPELLVWSVSLAPERLWALEDCRQLTRALERTLLAGDRCPARRPGTAVHGACHGVLDSASVARGSNPNRVNVTLDDVHAEKLRRLAERTHVNEGTIARSLLVTALDGVDPDPSNVTELLDGIPGAFERAELGLAQVRAGEGRPLTDL